MIATEGKYRLCLMIKNIRTFTISVLFAIADLKILNRANETQQISKWYHPLSPNI